MAKTVILHIVGEDAVLADIEREPEPTDNFIRVTNVRKKDGKEVAYLAAGVQAVMFPWHRITFVEIMPGDEERGQVIDFFRL